MTFMVVTLYTMQSTDDIGCDAELKLYIETGGNDDSSEGGRGLVHKLAQVDPSHKMVQEVM